MVLLNQELGNGATILLNYGVLGVLLLFFMLIGYRYLNMRFDQMKKEFEHKLRDKKLRAKGAVNVDGDRTYQVNLDMELEETVKE